MFRSIVFAALCLLVSTGALAHGDWRWEHRHHHHRHHHHRPHYLPYRPYIPPRYRHYDSPARYYAPPPVRYYNHDRPDSRFDNRREDW